MAMDTTPRWIKIGDALSQLVNVALLPTHRSTTANESISGRAHRMGWRRVDAVQATQQLLEQIEDAIADQTETVWNKYGSLVAQVQAATTVAQVNAVVW